MANRTPLIAGNWKLNKTTDEAVALATEIKAGADAPNVDVLVSPVFTVLASVAARPLQTAGRGLVLRLRPAGGCWGCGCPTGLSFGSGGSAAKIRAPLQIGTFSRGA